MKGSEPFSKRVLKVVSLRDLLEKGAQPFTPCLYHRFAHQLKEFMNKEFTLSLARVNDAIMRVPDRLSNAKGEALRSQYARIFCIGLLGHEQREGWQYLTLPFQTSLLTDPVLYLIAGGLLVLDHPTRPDASEFAFGKHAHVHDLPRHYSLYENRYPRTITCIRKGEIQKGEKYNLGLLINRFKEGNFRGPFAKVAA